MLTSSCVPNCSGGHFPVFIKKTFLMFNRTFALGFFYNCKQYFSYRAHKDFKYLPNVNGELWQTKHVVNLNNNTYSLINEGCTIGKESEIISNKKIFSSSFFL